MIPCVCPSFFIQKFKHLVFISPDYLLMYEIYLFLQYVEVYTFKIRNSLSKFVTNKHIDIQNNGYHQQRNAYLIVWNLLKKFVDMWQPGSLIFQKPTVTIKNSLYYRESNFFQIIVKFLRYITTRSQRRIANFIAVPVEVFEHCQLAATSLWLLPLSLEQQDLVEVWMPMASSYDLAYHPSQSTHLPS